MGICCAQEHQNLLELQFNPFSQKENERAAYIKSKLNNLNEKKIFLQVCIFRC